MEATGVLSELGSRMAALATDARVFVSYGQFTEEDADIRELAAQISTLLTDVVFVDDAWKRFFARCEPMAVSDIGHALEPLENHDAAAFMARIAAVDIIWPSHRLMDDDKARQAASRVVALLGQEATWWTNQDVECGAVNGITPAFDSLIAGTNGEYFAIALQVADD